MSLWGRTVVVVQEVGKIVVAEWRHMSSVGLAEGDNQGFEAAEESIAVADPAVFAAVEERSSGGLCNAVSMLTRTLMEAAVLGEARPFFSGGASQRRLVSCETLFEPLYRMLTKIISALRRSTLVIVWHRHIAAYSCYCW